MANKKAYFIRFSIIILGVLLCNSCNKITKDNGTEEALTKMVQIFPQLPKSKHAQSDIYKPVRTVTIEPDNIQIKLCTTNDSFPNCNEVVVITNKTGKSMAIPFPSNYYSSYWDFRFDEFSGGSGEFHTTFNAEFHTAMELLGLNDTLGTSWSVLDELFLSLLHCERAKLSDSNNIRSCELISQGDIRSENTDSAQIRLNETWDTISKIIHPQPGFMDYSKVFIDYENHRIYEIHSMNKIRNKLFPIEIRSYRLGCFAPPAISL